MKKTYLLFLLIPLFLSCESVDYKKLVDKAAEGNKCFLSMEEMKDPEMKYEIVKGYCIC